MTAHDCTTFDSACVRCDLSRAAADLPQAPEPDVAPSEAASAGVGVAKRLPLRPAPVSPDCADGYKCTACTGDAWDLTGDRPAHCTCTCHDTCGCIPYDPCTTPSPWHTP